MASLFQGVQAAVIAGRWVIGIHADDRLRERGIMAWQVVDGVREGRPRRERPDARPNPAVEIDQRLADGTPINAV